MDGLVYLILIAVALVFLGFCAGVVFAIHRYSEWEDDTKFLMRQVDGIVEHAHRRIRQEPDGRDLDDAA